MEDLSSVADDVSDGRRSTWLGWGRSDTVALLAVTMAGGALRLARLTTPPHPYSDEFIYKSNACWYVFASPTECEINDPVQMNLEHPPLGKWLIALGIRLAGNHVFGWRISSVVFGTLTIALLFLLARKVTGSTAAATVASGLLAVDFLHFVQSRMASLDVFVTFFALAALLAAVYDFDHMGERLERPRGNLVAGFCANRWRMVAGAAGGAAVASKWPGVFTFAGVVVLSLVWEMRFRKNRSAGLRDLFVREHGWIVVAFVLLPTGVYLASHVARLDGEVFQWPWAENSWARAFLGKQKFMLLFHSSDIRGTHYDQSPAWSWLLLRRPVVHSFEHSGGRIREIMAVGSPLVWWASLGAVAYHAVAWARRRTPTHAQLVVVTGFLSSYVPWLLLMPTRSDTFLNYVLPTVPFLCLAIASVRPPVSFRRPARAVATVFLLASLTLFVIYYPLLAAVPVTEGSWDRRILFQDCGTLRDLRLGRTTIAELDASGKEPPTPPGWCWI